MTDYTHPCGNSGTMMIRDTGSTIEFWINSNNSTTWTDHLPWGGTVNGVGVGGSYYYHAGSGWNRLGAWGVSYSQNITFSLGNTGTSGFGSGTSFTVWINRSTVPPAPNPVQLSSVTSTSVHAVFSGNGDGGSAILEWDIGWGTDPYTVQNIIGTYDYVISGLTPGTTYYFWARGRNANGNGPWSARSQATTLQVPDPPSTPVISSIGPTSVVATFSPNGDGGSPITGFQISYSTAVDGPLTTISATSPKTITGLQPGTQYWIWARAQNSVGFSPYSAPAIITTIAGARVKVGTDWKVAVPYVKEAGVWKLARPYVKVAGVWKETI